MAEVSGRATTDKRAAMEGKLGGCLGTRTPGHSALVSSAVTATAFTRARPVSSGCWWPVARFHTRTMQSLPVTLWVPIMPSPHSACEYSWIRPPSRSRLRTQMLLSAGATGILPSGGLWQRGAAVGTAVRSWKSRSWAPSLLDWTMIPRLSAAVNSTAGSFGGLVRTKVHIPGGYAELKVDNGGVRLRGYSCRVLAREWLWNRGLSG